LEAVEARIQAQRAEIESQKANTSAQQAELGARQAELTSAERQIQQAQANTQEQQARLGYYTIKAPFSGQIGNIPVKQGDFVSTETKLVKLAQNDTLEVNVSIPVDRAPDIKTGDAIELLNAQNEVVGTSRVFFIAPNVANGTQSVLVKARLDNTNGKLRADQFKRARIIWKKREGLKVPTIAISRIAGENFVFVAEKGKTGLVARQRPVKLGDIEGNNYQVLEGLKPNDLIAVTGLLQLSDGAAIVPQSQTF
jgi:RND family efflux transporter MFP subunit